MSHLTTNPARPATAARRAQIIAEAVVSAYLNDITPTTRRRDRARIHRGCADVSPRPTARSPLAARARGHAVAPRRRAALQLGA